MDAKGLVQTIEPSRLTASIDRLGDAELEHRLRRLAGIERTALVVLLAHLGEFDRRRLYADLGQPSLFAYCVRILGYSEQAAYKRIQAARAARNHPRLLQRLADGQLTLTAAVILAPHLRMETLPELLECARGKSTRELEALAAGLAPRPEARDCLRALPGPWLLGPGGPRDGACRTGSPGMEIAVAGSTPAQPPAASGLTAVPAHSGNGPRERIQPLSPQRYLFRFTAGAALLGKYDLVLRLFRGARTGNKMETVVEAALDSLLDRLDPERRRARRMARIRPPARPAGPRARSRRVPTTVRDQVWARDAGRCTFIGPDGRRCPGTDRLEVDHVLPYALGGPSDDAGNLRLACRAHNQLLARRVFGNRSGGGLRSAGIT